LRAADHGAQAENTGCLDASHRMEVPMHDPLSVAIFTVIDAVMLTLGDRTHLLAPTRDRAVLTVAVVAACQFQNPHARAVSVLRGLPSLSRALSRSRFHRRLPALARPCPWVSWLLDLLCDLFAFRAVAFTLDSLPVPVCHRVRARRCGKVQGSAYDGYCAAKEQRVVGWHVPRICRDTGVPVSDARMPVRSHDLTPPCCVPRLDATACRVPRSAPTVARARWVGDDAPAGAQPAPCPCAVARGRGRGSGTVGSGDRGHGRTHRGTRRGNRDATGEQRVGGVAGVSDERAGDWPAHRSMVAGDTGELHPRRDARSGGGRVPTGQDGVGTGAATIGHEGAQGAQIGHSGNGRLRTTADLATLSAVRLDPMLRAFYQRLREAGKPVKVARCAAARKLLHLAWALVTKRHPFDPLRHLTPVPIQA